MRDILFRGKRLDNGAWVYGSLLQVECEDGSIVTAIFDRKDSGGDAEVHPSTVGQYTGLLDKNGERIFEGDVLTVDGEVGCFELKFNENTAMFIMDGDAIRASFNIFGNDEVEVVGNIHDNPELLEGGESE